MDDPGVLGGAPPHVSTDEAATFAERVFGVAGEAEPLVSERDQNFALRAADGSAWVLKVSNAAEQRDVVEMEIAACAHVAAMDPTLPVPLARPAADGSPVATLAAADGTEHLVRLIPRMPGRTRSPEDLDDAALRHVGERVAALGRALRGYFHPAAGRVIEWDLRHLPRLRQHAAGVSDPDRRALLDEVLARYDERVAPALPRLRAQVIHNDATLDNLLFNDGRISGIIDFGDMAHTALVLDVPATLQSLVRRRGGVLQVAAPFLEGYAAITPLEQDEAILLGDLLAARMAQTILITAWRTPQYPDNAYITGWAEPAWELLRELRGIGWDEASEALAEAALGRASTPVPLPDMADLIDRRTRVLGSALSPLTYREPLYLVRGDGAWMYDPDGRGYLDAYNNVPVVGHAHPRVAAAIARQAATLNTNTRYLHPAVVELAERLIASMPTGLDTVMFVNSGSEANDLAWRLATAATGADGGLVTEWAYHGVTDAIAHLSPSEWPGGRRPPHVETIAPPDTYRTSRPDAGAAIERLADAGHPIAALFLDGFFTSDGIFAPEAAWVADAIRATQAAGGLFVADEVQSGHGRSGAGLWRFPSWGIVPDVVTLGKPMGNGHPIAAVVTRSDIVARFSAENEFFSTFGGNPVACAAALAVLDVIEEEGLVANARTVGDELGVALAQLGARHHAIGDVRGAGLMRAVELVIPGTRDPDAALADEVKNAMRQRGVLVGTTRREGNVLKIRPPLCVRPTEAALIVEALDAALTAAGGNAAS